MPEVFQSAEALARTIAQIDEFRSELESEFGPFRTKVLRSNRVWLQPVEALEPGAELGYICYLSDESPEGRLVVDDYLPEGEVE